MAVLVAYASKHGATQDIAERIAAKLRETGNDVEVRPVGAVGDLAGYEAAVIGSAVYYGSWMKETAELVRGHRAALAGRPVWLFSVGPLGVEIEDTEEQPREIAELRAAIGARDHRVFFGALDHTKLSFPERMIVKAVRAPEGDYRDWDAIDAWAGEIARALAAAGAAGSRG